MIVDWESYLKCDVCFVLADLPCLSLSGVGPDGKAVEVQALLPHGGREQRAVISRG